MPNVGVRAGDKVEVIKISKPILYGISISLNVLIVILVYSISSSDESLPPDPPPMPPLKYPNLPPPDTVVPSKVVRHKESDYSDKIETQLYYLALSNNPEHYALENGMDFDRGRIKIQVDFSKEINEKIDYGIIDYKHDSTIQLNVTPEELLLLMNRKDIQFIGFPVEVFPQNEVTEADTFMNTDQIRSQTGLTGRGVNVAVIDCGFGQMKEIESVIEVPKIFRKNNAGVKQDCMNNAHGTQVAEIINDVAPNAKLFLYSIGNKEDFKEAVKSLKKDKIDVVNLSMSAFEPSDGNSEFTKEVEKIIVDDIPVVVAAGNHAKKHWEGNASDNNSNGFLEFDSQDESLKINVKSRLLNHNETIYLFWYDDVDLDLFLYKNHSLKAESTIKNSEDRLYEIIHFSRSNKNDFYEIKIIGPQGKEHNVDVFVVEYELEDPVSRRSVLSPTDATRVISVGAWSLGTNQIPQYSSHGPTKNGIQVPLILGPTDVSTSLGKFTGTSASSPHITGLIALALEKNSTLNVEDILSSLKQCESQPCPTESLGYGMVDVSHVIPEFGLFMLHVLMISIIFFIIVDRFRTNLIFRNKSSI